MRRLFTILFALALLLAAFPSVAIAADCASSGGRCVFSGTCANGSPIYASGCIPLVQNCCPVSSGLPDCHAAGGYCVISGTCANGSPLSASGCGPFRKCCPSGVGNPNQSGLGCTTDSGSEGINTAIGCISVEWNTGGFISSIIALAVGVGGGFALLLMLYGTFIITTSAGIPDKLKAGKEIITSAIVGLIFIILSVVLMQLIGVDILGIPGL